MHPVAILAQVQLFPACFGLFWLRLLDGPTMCSIPLLPSMLGGVTPASVIREILCEAGWTLCHNYGAASQRHARGRFVLQWKLVDTGEEPVFAFNLNNQVDGELAFGGVNSAHCT